MVESDIFVGKLVLDRSRSIEYVRDHQDHQEQQIFKIFLKFGCL